MAVIIEVDTLSAVHDELMSLFVDSNVSKEKMDRAKQLFSSPSITQCWTNTYIRLAWLHPGRVGSLIISELLHTKEKGITERIQEGIRAYIRTEPMPTRRKKGTQ